MYPASFSQRDVFRFLRVAACVRASFLFGATSPVVMRVVHVSFFHSSINDESQTRFSAGDSPGTDTQGEGKRD